MGLGREGGGGGPRNLASFTGCGAHSPWSHPDSTLSTPARGTGPLHPEVQASENHPSALLMGTLGWTGVGGCMELGPGTQATVIY